MKMKKFFSLMMALAMTAALAVPAFATATEFGTASNKTEQNVTVKAVTQEPTISIAMPSVNTNPVIVNPYGIKWSGDLNGLTALTDQTDQIISRALNVENKTNVKLKVDVTVTTTLGGNMTLSTTDLANGKTEAADIAAELGKVTKNQAYVYVAFKDMGTTKGTTVPAKVEADTSAGTPANYIVLKSGAVTVKDLLTLPAASESAAGYLAFGFGGNAATKPTTGWTAKDTITAAVAFTFTPVV
jgi:hypothetical protein